MRVSLLSLWSVDSLGRSFDCILPVADLGFGRGGVTQVSPVCQCSRVESCQ